MCASNSIVARNGQPVRNWYATSCSSVVCDGCDDRHCPRLTESYQGLRLCGTCIVKLTNITLSTVRALSPAVLDILP